MSKAIRRGLPPAAAGIPAPADKRFRRSDARPTRKRSWRAVARRLGVFAVIALLVVATAVWTFNALVDISLFRIDTLNVRGTVHLSAHPTRLRDRPAVDLLVDDDGDGIAPQHRELVFTRFWQGGAKHGTGLGLYVVRGLVEAHGGVVAVEDAPGGGALVRATFPDQDA